MTEVHTHAGDQDAQLRSENGQLQGGPAGWWLLAGTHAIRLSGQRFLSSEGCGARSVLSDPQHMQNPGFIF